MRIALKTGFSVAALALALGIPHVYAAEESQAALTAEAKLTEGQAREAALKMAPGGTVTSAELEREHGRLIWSFDIARPTVKGVTEIQVDAKSGKIVLVKKESSAQEAKEVKAEKRLTR